MAIFAGLKKIKKKTAAKAEQPDPHLSNGPPSKIEADHTYEELLSRIARIIRENNPDLAGDSKKFTMALPQVQREGSKKTNFSNILDVCTKINRPQEHFIQFLLSELGTTGSLDAEMALVIRGRFQQKHIEAVLKRYVQEYVQCKTCKSHLTSVTKENRLYFQKCDKCGASRTVSAIKSGFQAQTDNREAQRKKLL